MLKLNAWVPDNPKNVISWHWDEKIFVHFDTSTIQTPKKMERRVHYNKIKWPIHACVIKCKVGSRFFMWHKISDLAFKIFETWKIIKLSFFLQIWCYNSSPPALFSSPKLAIMVAQSDLKLKKKICRAILKIPANAHSLFCPNLTEYAAYNWPSKMVLDFFSFFAILNH